MEINKARFSILQRYPSATTTMNTPILFSLLFLLCFGLNGQQLNDPQSLYDAPGGIFDVDSIRDLKLDFEEPNYHNILVNSFFNDPSLSLIHI